MKIELTDAEVAMLVGILGMTAGKGLYDLYVDMYKHLDKVDPLLLAAAIRMGERLTDEYETRGLNEEEELAVSLEGE